MAGAPFAVGGRHELLQDAAVSRRVAGSALLPQLRELPLQRPHGLQPGTHTRELSFYQVVDVTAVIGRPGHELEQPTHIGQRHIQRPAMAYEGKMLHVAAAVGAVAVLPALRWPQEPRALVVPDRFHVHASGPRQFADAHVAPKAHSRP